MAHGFVATLTAASFLALALPSPAGPMGSVATIETDKGCKAYVYLQDHFDGPPPKMKFTGTCAAGKPISGKGKLMLPALALGGTWINGVLDGAATIEPVGDDGKLGPADKAVFKMGCITSIGGQSGEMPGCTDAMAPYIKKAP